MTDQFSITITTESKGMTNEPGATGTRSHVMMAFREKLKQLATLTDKELNDIRQVHINIATVKR